MTAERHAEEFGPPEPPAYSDDGVDLTLIRWMLSLTPAERLRVLEEGTRSVLEMRDALRNN